MAKGKSAKYYANNPEANEKKKAYAKKYNKQERERKKRSELVKYNRDKGTYGNGDGLDASHKGGRIVGMESASKNRGRKEKSRLKGSTRRKN